MKRAGSIDHEFIVLDDESCLPAEPLIVLAFTNQICQNLPDRFNLRGILHQRHHAFGLHLATLRRARALGVSSGRTVSAASTATSVSRRNSPACGPIHDCARPPLWLRTKCTIPA